MSRSILKTCLLAALIGTAAYADYGVITRFPLGSEASGFDYLQIDPATRRMYIGRGDRIEVIDVDSGKKLGEVMPAPRVHGVALALEFNHGFTSNALDRTVTMFDVATLKTLRVIKYTGIKPDSITYDPQTKQVFVCNGGPTGDLTVIDPATGAIVGTVELGASKLEQIALDGRGHGFVNDEVKNAVQVFDTRTLKKVAMWPLASGEEPTGMAIDAAHHRLFAACSNNKMVVLNSDTGAVVATLPIGARPDGAAFDPATQCAFSANGDGTLTVIHEDSPDKFTVVQNLPTEPNCRTIGIDPKTSRVFLPTAKLGPPPPPSPEPIPRPIQPETFAIVVVGPQ